MDSTPTEDRGPGSTGPAQTAFDALPSGHRHIIALAAICSLVSGVLGIAVQLGEGAISGPIRAANASVWQLWQLVSVAPLAEVFLLAAVLRPRQSALAMTAPRLVVMAICVTLSMGWAVLYQAYPTSLVVSILSILSQTIPLLVSSGLLWIIARTLESRPAEVWAGLAVMGDLLYIAWSIVTTLGGWVPALASPIPERIAFSLTVLLVFPGFVASVLVARHALASIKRSDAGATAQF